MLTMEIMALWMTLRMNLGCFEILRHNYIVDRVIDQSVLLSLTVEDHLIPRRVVLN